MSEEGIRARSILACVSMRERERERERERRFMYSFFYLGLCASGVMIGFYDTWMLHCRPRRGLDFCLVNEPLYTGL